MKKFLSSLLALTMILSLVIVPAQADNYDEYRIVDGAAINLEADKTSVDGGETVKFTTNPSITVQKKARTSETWTDCTGTDYQLIYNWNNAVVDAVNSAKASKSWTADKADRTERVTCSVTVKTADGKTQIGNVISETTNITVKAETPLIYVGGLELTAKVGGNKVGRTGVKEGDIVSLEVSGTPRVKLGTNGAATEANATAWAWTGVSSNTNTASWTADAATASKTISCNVTVTSNSKTVSVPLSVTIPVTALTLSITGNVEKVSGSYEVLKGGRLQLTASSTGVENPTYKWYNASGNLVETGDTFVLTSAATVNTTRAVTLTCKVFSGDNETPVKTTDCTYTIVDEDVHLTLNKESVTLSKKGAYEDITASVIDWSTPNQSAVTGEVKYTFTPSKRNVVSLSSDKNTTGKTRITLEANGDVTITVEATYKGKTLPSKTISVNGELLSASLDKVENGATVGYTRNDLMSAAEEAIYAFDRTRVDVTDVTVVLPSGTSYGTFYDDEDCGRNDKVTGSYSMDSGDELYFKSENGYVGSDVKVTLNVKTRSDGDYSVTAVIPVTMRKGEFESQVTGSDKTYKVTVPSGYEAYWVLSTSKEPAASEYDGSWATKTAGKYTSKSLYSFSTSNLKDGEGKLYIVAIDDKGIAYSGVIELKANAYTIKYSVVAGESVTFDQKRFESFMEDYADDNIKTSKGDYFEFDYVKFDSLPNSTREGVLYEGKDKIKTSTEVENLDKVTFESVAKAKDTIKVPFTLYAKQYDKNDKVIDKKVSMTGVVEITVVKEDIVFEVGVNSAVKLGSDKFIDFLRDSDKSYRKADLDYVTFDVGKNSAITSYFNGTGALYRYYNGNTGINATVSAKDEFYYNPKTSSKHYDLDDVTYVTSKFAKVGDIVYIPFTAYGTKSGQKAEGTLAIKVKQTMNFVDVHTYDYFYDSVQWAVNLGITKGTSATTFSPKQGCTRAQIVTFLWRAANSPAPRSSTNKFTDVYATTHADYMKAIIWATEQGITTGTGNGKFSPDDTCTRAQIVTFLYRFKSNPAVYGSLNFSDVNKTEHAAFYNAILWAVNNKITTGYGNGIFDPNGTCNRGDAVTFLYRALA